MVVVAELTLEVAIGFTDSASSICSYREVDSAILTAIGAGNARKVTLSYGSYIDIRVGLRLRRVLFLT